MNKHVFGATWALSLVLALGACGDDDGGNGGGSGVDGDKLGKDLTASEAKALCKSAALPELTEEQTCNFAVLFSTDKASCEQAREACLADDTPPDDESDDCSDASEDLVNCEATVKELETCFDAIGDQFVAAASELSCDDAGKVSFEDISARPEACQPVADKCPDLLEEVEEE